MSIQTTYGAVQTEALTASLANGASINGNDIDTATVPGNKADVQFAVAWAQTGSATGRVEIYIRRSLGTSNLQVGEGGAYILVHTEPVIGSATAYRTPMLSLAASAGGSLPESWRIRVINETDAAITDVDHEYRSMTQADV